jgi:D-mycarose 3-C-methyltransferase
LVVYRCQICGLVQLTNIVPPEKVFSNYPYYTGKSSKTLPEHFQKLGKKLTEEYNLTNQDLVIDIGSNDGTLLKAFGKCQKLGIEPCFEIAKYAEDENGVPTLPEFFNSSLAQDILNWRGKAKVITATNVFAHIDNLYDVMAGVKMLLEDDGVFVIEVSHLPEMVKNNEFDAIYHEHVSYFLVEPLRYLGDAFNLPVFKVEKIPIHGGSIRAYFRNNGCLEDCLEDTSIYEVLGEEVDGDMYYQEVFNSWGDKIKHTKKELVETLTVLKKLGKRIVGYGAPAKGNTLLNYCKIGPKFLDYLIDTTPAKQGKYSPGMHIPVVSPEKFYKDPPDYALMLAWNYKEEILKKESKFIENGGKFIVPIPEPEVVS